MAQTFDLCLLNNNLYYFSPEDRTPLLQRLAGHLKDGGRLAVQVPELRQARNDPVLLVFHAYLLGHNHLSGLPYPDDVAESLAAAGLTHITRTPLWFGAQWMYFVARKRLP